MGKDPRDEEREMKMTTSYVPNEILRTLPYEYRIPMNDEDNFELFDNEFKDIRTLLNKYSYIYDEGDTDTV
jgi:hypothetical protein